MMNRLVWITLCGLLVSCSHSAIDDNAELAKTGGATRNFINTGVFRHVVFARVSGSSATDLHIYVGGDGQAFLAPDRIADDPTPPTDLALQLMLSDKADVVYVARPCYHGTARDEECGPIYWTLLRYSNAVVDSMAMAIRSLTELYKDRQITLIGYSGGGVIAMLVARRLNMPVTVVTVSAPLDVAAWLDHHNYTPMQESVNPAKIEKWPQGMRRIHLFGAEDQVVPAWTQTNAFFGMKEDDQVRVISGFTHTCCWLEDWPQLLQSFE